MCYSESPKVRLKKQLKRVNFLILVLSFFNFGALISALGPRPKKSSSALTAS